MTTKTTGLLILLIGLGACTPRDKQQTQQDLHKSGEAVKKELKKDAVFVKQEALKAREETQKDVKKLKEKIDEKKAEDSH